MKRQVEFGSLVLVSEDKRRKIKEIELGNGSIQQFIIGNGAPLSEHFHRKKFEIFCIIKGRGVFRAAAVDQQGKIVGEIEEFKVGPGSVILIPPYVAHMSHTVPGTIFLCFSSKPFDQNDMVVCLFIKEGRDEYVGHKNASVVEGRSNGE